MYRPRSTRRIRYRDLDLWPGRFRVGTWAFVLHRLTGLALLLFLVLHILAAASVILRPWIFDRVMAFLHRPWFAPLELAVLAALLYHGLNGIRVILLDLGVGVRHQRTLFWVAFGLAAAGTLAGARYLLLPRVPG